MQNKKKKTIAILFGGASPEYPVSLQSAHAVVTHLNTEKYAPVLVGISREGHWFHYHGGADAILNDTWHSLDPGACTPAFISPCRKNPGLVALGEGTPTHTRLDAAFPVLHGCFGEDGTVQGLLQLAGIPIVGCGTLASALCMHKDMAHRLVAQAGIAVPRAVCFSHKAAFAKIAAAATCLGYPIFIKPVRAGSSFGISRVESADGLAAAVQAAFQFDTQITLEEAISGFEVGCAILGEDEQLLVSQPDEVELEHGFFDYTEKYSLATSKIHVPARISPEKAEAVKQSAARIYRLLGCSGFARVDQFITPDGRIVFNEVNTIPGFTAHSRYPSMMQTIGLDFATVLERLVETAVSP